ncbi:MAG TPA: ABC transporter permease [Opitutaceae bacterium]|nr:ABC transporter permease [Opitutaceae bacterium]
MSHLERIIRPRRAWFSIDWRRLLQYRDLLWTLVRRDFVARYQQTILGPAWFVIQPLVASLAFTAVFGRALHTSTDQVNPFLFYLCGMLPWGFFSNILSNAGNTFQANAAVFTKVYFPRLIVPCAVVIGCLAPLALQLVVFLAFYLPAVAGGHTAGPDWTLLALLPLVTLQLSLLGLGTSLLTSGFSAKYRDLQHALPFLVQIWLFVTPVIYPVSQLGPRARVLAGFNPLTPLVESFRRAFFGTGTVTPVLMGMSLAGTLLLLAAGLYSFQRAERTFADTV